MLKKLLSQSSYWVINKELASKLGFEPTLLLTYLIECADMLDQPFYQQRDRILKTLGWTEHQYRKSVKILKDNNFISVEVRGIPPRNYWTINEGEIQSFFKLNPHDISVKSTQPYKRDIHATKKRNIKQEINNNNNEVVEGETTPEGLSVTSSTPHKEKKSGWEKFVDLFPTNKQNGIIEGAIIWNELSQSEKQQVMRHVVPYLKNTEPTFIKQIGKYMESRLWEQMKSPTKTEIGTIGRSGMIDYNLIKYFSELSEQPWEDAQKEFFTLHENDKKEIIKAYKQDLKK